MPRKRKSKIELIDYDSARYLRSDKAISEYLKAAFENANGDPAVIINALNVASRARGILQLSNETGLTRAGLYRALSANGNPSVATLLKVLDALHVKLTVKAA